MNRTKTIFLSLTLVVLSVVGAFGQNSSSLLKSGIYVEILTTNIIGPGQPISSAVSMSEIEITSAESRTSSKGGPLLSDVVTSNGNSIRRLLVDKSNNLAYGYDLTVERVPGTEDVLVSLKPISKTAVQLSKGGGLPGFATVAGRLSLQNAEQTSTLRLSEARKNVPGERIEMSSTESEPVTIKLGGTISVTLMENPQTGARLREVIRIYEGSQTKFEESKSSYNDFAASYGSSAADFTLNNLNLSLTEPRVVLASNSLECSGCTASGRLVWVYIEGKGRFIFSIQPEPGFDFGKVGVVAENKISFEHNGEVIGIENRTRVLPSNGKFNLWMMYDGNYRPESPLSPSMPIAYGSGSDMTKLLNVANGGKLP